MINNTFSNKQVKKMLLCKICKIYEHFQNESLFNFCCLYVLYSIFYEQLDFENCNKLTVVNKQDKKYLSLIYRCD